MSDSEVLMTVTEDELDVLVSIAIRRAEILSETGSPAANEAWREVMIYERRLAELTPANEIPGSVARLGAVTAALAARDHQEASRLASRYCAEEGFPLDRRLAFERSLIDYWKDQDHSVGLPAQKA